MNGLVDDVHGIRLNDDQAAQSSSRQDAYQRVIRKHHRARDITEEFTKAAKVLNIGQLVKDDSFSLFESVQALELMDPKMDSGYLAPGETLDDTYSVQRSLLPSEVLAILDQLLCYEMSWHQGYPLAQNLFTSHYIDYLLSQDRPPKTMPTFRGSSLSEDEPNVLVEGVLKAYCVGVIKTCDIVVEMVAGQQYYEEEDFNTNTFNRKLLVDIDDDACVTLLDQSISYLRTEQSIAQPLRNALILRLAMRKDLIITFLPNESIQYTSDHWTQLISHVGQLHSSHTLACPVPEAFSAKLQRRLASTVPPRPIVDVKIEEACEQLERLYLDMQEVLRLGNIWTCDASFPVSNLMSICLVHCNRPSPPSAVVRALLQALLFSEGRLADRSGLQALLLDALRDLLPDYDMIQEMWWGVEVPSDWRYQAARDIDAFLDEGAPVFEGILRSLCQNPCRIRRCLTNSLIDIDTFCTRLSTRFSIPPTHPLPPPVPAPLLLNPSSASASIILPLLHTTMLHFTHHMMHHLIALVTQLGFTQDIYLSPELPRMYTYLSRVTRAHLDGLQRHIDFLRACDDGIEATPSTMGLSARKRAKQRQLGVKLERLQALTQTLIATAEFAKGLAALYAALAHPLISAVDAAEKQRRVSPYANLGLQRELRMRPFEGLTNGVSYAGDDEKSQGNGEGTRGEESIHDMLTRAQQGLEAARDAYKAVLKLVPASTPTPGNTSSNPSTAAPTTASTATLAGLTALSRTSQFRSAMQAELRTCLTANLALLNVRKCVKDMEGAESGTMPVKWHIESAEEREKRGGGGWWVVPVLE